MLEMMVTFNYKAKGWKEAIKTFCGWIGSVAVWILMIMALHIVVVAVLYISILFGSSLSNRSNSLYSLYAVGNATNLWNDLNPESYPICNQKWNANLSVIDMAALSLMVYDVGEMERKFNATFQDEVCLYFDGMVPDAHSEQECSWNVVYRHTDNPLFVHLRRDLEHRHDDDPVFVV